MNTYLPGKRQRMLFISNGAEIMDKYVAYIPLEWLRGNWEVNQPAKLSSK